jgi:ribosomal protein L11 methyltransferase
MAAPQWLWRIEFRVPEEAVAGIEGSLGPDCLAVSTFEDTAPGRWRIEALANREPDRKALERTVASALGEPDWTGPLVIEPVAARNWLDESRRRFPPIRVGRYYIHGSHVTDPPPAGAIAIRLDAGQAFGTGEHGSTRGCLLAIDQLAKQRRFRKPLDLGCGAGVLAIAMAKTWRVPVVAADIDSVAVRVARENARLNRVAALVRVAGGPGYRPAAVAQGGPYDLIIANILAGPLCRMAGNLARNLRPDGVAVLSGLLDRDVRWVTAAHRAFGLRLVGARAIDGWTTLVVGR